MKRILVLFCIVAFVAGGAIAHHPKQTVLGEKSAKKQPPVKFEHEKHMKLAKTCETCHHTEKGLTIESKVDVKKCSECHLNPTDPKAGSMMEMSPTKNPFHVKCIGCHKTEKKGPTVCKDCHKK